MKDEIVEEVRKIRKEIEKKHAKNWKDLESYFLKKQKAHKKRLYSGQPQRLVKTKVA